jgi:hypothetical protein
MLTLGRMHHHASGLSPQTASIRGSGRIGFNSVSQQPRAVQAKLANLREGRPSKMLQLKHFPSQRPLIY